MIALDTAPDPANTVDITFATDNFAAGEPIGKWTAAQLGRQNAAIGLVDLFSDQVASVDYDRDQGFLTGMGIPPRTRPRTATRTRPAATPAARAATTRSSATSPRTVTRPTGAPPWRRCLSKNPNINLVYAINEPAAVVPTRR